MTFQQVLCLLLAFWYLLIAASVFPKIKSLNKNEKRDGVFLVLSMFWPITLIIALFVDDGA